MYDPRVYLPCKHCSLVCQQRNSRCWLLYLGPVEAGSSSVREGNGILGRGSDELEWGIWDPESAEVFAVWQKSILQPAGHKLRHRQALSLQSANQTRCLDSFLYTQQRRPLPTRTLEWAGSDDWLSSVTSASVMLMCGRVTVDGLTCSEADERKEAYKAPSMTI